MTSPHSADILLTISRRIRLVELFAHLPIARRPRAANALVILPADEMHPQELVVHTAPTILKNGTLPELLSLTSVLISLHDTSY